MCPMFSGTGLRLCMTGESPLLGAMGEAGFLSGYAAPMQDNDAIRQRKGFDSRKLSVYITSFR